MMSLSAVSHEVIVKAGDDDNGGRRAGVHVPQGSIAEARRTALCRDHIFSGFCTRFTGFEGGGKTAGK
jgi:hypothetical protein